MRTLHLTESNRISDIVSSQVTQSDPRLEIRGSCFSTLYPVPFPRRKPSRVTRRLVHAHKHKQNYTQTLTHREVDGLERISGKTETSEGWFWLWSWGVCLCNLKQWPERGDLTVVSKEVYFFPARFLSFCDSVLLLPILFLCLSVQEPSKNFKNRQHAAWCLHVKMNGAHINKPFYVLPGPQNVKSIVDIPTLVLPCAVEVFCTCRSDLWHVTVKKEASTK